MSRSKPIFASLIALGLAASSASTQSKESSATALVGRIDVSCILKSWRIKGVRVCLKSGIPTPCVVVENAYPVGILESVKRPFTSSLSELSTVLLSFSKIGPLSKLTSSHTSDSAPSSDLSFSETRVLLFVPALPDLIPLALPPQRGFAVSYLSEPDALSYRNPLLESILKAPQISTTLPCCDVVWPINPFFCCGGWGSFYPRVGFVNHPSSVVGSYLLSLRAGRIASDPAGHLALGLYPYPPRTGHYVQPPGSPCLKIGDPLTLSVERGRGNLDQSHLLLHFGIFEECKPCFDSRLVGPRSPR